MSGFVNVGDLPMNLFINLNDKLGVKFGSVIAEVDLPLPTVRLICDRFTNGDKLDKQLIEECLAMAIKSKPVRIGNMHELRAANSPMVIVGPRPKKIPHSIASNIAAEKYAE